MSRMNGLWKVEDTGQKYKNYWIEVCKDKVIRPDGEAGNFATVKMKPSVSVLEVDEDEYLIRIKRESGDE